MNVIKQFFYGIGGIISTLAKYPVSLGICLVGLVLSILADINGIIVDKKLFWMQFIGLIILTFMFVILIICKAEQSSKYLTRAIGTSVAWFISAVVFLEFKESGFSFIYKLFTCWEYIFLGCVLPDFFALFEKKEDGPKKEENS